jgi:hypothetical protein
LPRGRSFRQLPCFFFVVVFANARSFVAAALPRRPLLFLLPPPLSLSLSPSFGQLPCAAEERPPFPARSNGNSGEERQKEREPEAGENAFRAKKKGRSKKTIDRRPIALSPLLLFLDLLRKNEKQNNEQVEASDKSLSARVTELEQAVARLSTNTSNPSS